MTRILAPLAAALVLASCQAYPVGSPIARLDGAPQGATIQVKTAIAHAPGFRVMETVTPYDADSINHLVVQLFTHAGSPDVETPVKNADDELILLDITDHNFNRTLTFSNLKPNTNYRVRGFAYKAEGTDAADLISTTALSDDATQRSYVDLDVTDDDAPTVGALGVRLLDKTFDGQASSADGITVTDGGLNAVANEAIVQN